MQQRRIRLLREKHNIPANQYAKYSRVSRQRLIEIEQGDKNPTEHTVSLVASALGGLIAQRRKELDALEADYLRYRDNLLDYIDEEELF